MPKYMLSAILFFVFAGLQAQDRSKDPMARDRDLGGFTRIEVRNGIDLFLVADDQETVAVSARETEDRERIVTRVTNGTLYIYYDLKGSLRWPLNMKLRAYVSFKTLQSLEASSACNVVLDGKIKAEDFRLSLSGASDFTGYLDAVNLDVALSGSSDTKLSGIAKNLKIEASGASDAKAFELVAENAKVNASGASDINITVNGLLEADASGASDIRYKGKGLVKSVNSGMASSIKKVE